MLKFLLPLALIASPVLAAGEAPLPATGPWSLSGHEWKVTHFADGSAPTAGEPGLTFGADGHLSGPSGCNRFMGSWAANGQAISFSQIASTMMACPEAQMETERKMLQSFEKITWFSLTPGGALELMGADGLILRATRSTSKAQP